MALDILLRMFGPGPEAQLERGLNRPMRAVRRVLPATEGAARPVCA